MDRPDDENQGNGLPELSIKTQPVEAVKPALIFESLTREDQKEGNSFKLSPQRWLVLAAMVLYGLFVAMLSEFRSILDVMLSLLGLPISEYTYIKQTFMYLPAITSIPTGWFIDKYGLRPTMYVAALFLLVGNGFRFLMFDGLASVAAALELGPQLKRACWIISGFATTQGAGIYFCAPLKVSEGWFGHAERSIAWTMMISSYNIGVSVAAFLWPRIVQGPADLKYLAYLNLFSGLLVTLAIVAFITRSKPEQPPSERTLKATKSLINEAQHLSWLQSIRRIVQERDIVLHLLHETIYESLTLAAHSFIHPILIKSGHTSVFVGNVLSINSLLSVLMMVGLAAFVHQVKDVTATCKLASVARTLAFILHLYTMLYPCSDWLVLAAALLYMVCKCWSLPNINNMTAHLICGAVSEATVTGVSVTLYTAFASLSSIAFVKLRIDHDQHRFNQGDYSRSIAMTATVCLLNCALYWALFKGRPANSSGDKTTSNAHTEVA